jgi:hypothetical protein
LLRIERRIGLLRARADHLGVRVGALEDGIRHLRDPSARPAVAVRTADITITIEDPGVIKAPASAFGPLAPGAVSRLPGTVWADAERETCRPSTP